MISLRRIFGLMLLFFFFEAVVAIVTTFAYPSVNVFLACVAMTGLAVGVWAVFALVTRLMSRPRAPQPTAIPRPAVVASPRPSFGDDSFTLELNSLVVEANRRLAASVPLNSRGETPTVGNLPLYLLVGGEGAGKTSAILNSGLEPRLLAGESARESTTIPTRLCNLWFAEGAVFADVSGRVLMQEAENWERLLRYFSQPTRIPRWKQILFGRRSDVNLKGMLLVCDANPFVRGNDSQRTTAVAKTLSDRLQAAGAIFRREFPVYVVFSKCDSVQYFAEFFANVSEPESRRLLGATLPFVRLKTDSADIYADREGKRLTNYFNRLYMSLAEKRLVLLAREDEAAKKSAAYEFPRELKKVRGDVVQFLLDVFRPNPLQVGPRLRGFYVSGQRWVVRNLGPTAEGTMAGFTVMPKRSDATVFFRSKPATPGVPLRSAGSGGAVPKWMFLSDLFHNVVLKDRAGNVAPRVNTREQEYRSVALAGVGVFLLLLSLLWANSWRHNRELLNNVQALVEAVHPLGEQSGLRAESLVETDSLREPLAALLQYERHSPPLPYRWGLYAGHDVTRALDSLYFDRFRRTFLDPMLGLLTTNFIQLEPSNPAKDDVYNLLKSYRMITSGECKPDADFLNSALMPIWSSAVSFSQDDSAALIGRQMQFYVSELADRNPYGEIREDGRAVRQAQDYLRAFNGPDTIFRALVEQVNREKQSDSLSRYAANFGDVLTGPNSMDAAYTRDGWDAMMDSIRSHKLASAGEPCVVGAQSGSKNLAVDADTEREVEDLYVKSYIQHWKSFLDAHHVEAFRGAQDAAQRLHVLADNNRSPLLAVIYMASHNTDLAAAQSGESVVSTAIEETKNSVGKSIGKIFGGKPNDPGASLVRLAAIPSGKEVAREFGPVRMVVDPANAATWLNPSNQAYVQALEELGNSIGAMPVKIDSKEPADQQAVDRANKALQTAIAAHHSLGAVLPNTPSQIDVELKAFLEEPITYAGRVIRAVPLKPVPPPPPTPRELAGPIIQRVNESATALCHSLDGLHSKYPFDPAAAQDVSQTDLNEVFAPKTGSLARFEQSQDVSRAYTHQGRAWAKSDQFPATYSDPFVQLLNNLNDFADALYSDGGANPRFDYMVSLDGTGKVAFELDVDGHVLKYNPGKLNVPATLVWPPVTQAATKLTLRTGFKGGASYPTQFPGSWSLLRLLDEADDQNGNLFTFRTFQFVKSRVPLQDAKGNPVTVQIRVKPSAGNIFSKGYFGKLRCENLTGKALW